MARTPKPLIAWFVKYKQLSKPPDGRILLGNWLGLGSNPLEKRYRTRASELSPNGVDPKIGLRTGPHFTINYAAAKIWLATRWTGIETERP
jgi:hypothetical protein